jgi:hypothetical protein
MTHQINDEIERLIKEIRALDIVLFKVDTKFLYKLLEEKQKMWNKVNFLKKLKKAYILKKD